jgi:NAD(P)-dependent dehydrogenase (short-subunit alcohol dehydrogenase family)/acyl carrier protein
MTPQLDIAPIRARCDEQITGDAHYADMNERGLHYGPWFQGITSIWRNRAEREVLARIDAHADLIHDTHSSLHPTLLDASFQALLAATRGDPQGLGKEVYVPVRIGQVRFYARPQARFYCYTRLSRAEPGRIVGDVTLTDEQGRVFAEIQQVEARALTNKRGDALAALDDWLYQFEWRPSPLAAEQSALLRGPWLVLAEEGPLADQLAHALGECGVERAVVARCRRVEDESSSTGWRLDPKLSELSPNWAAGQVQGVVSLLATEFADEHIGAHLAAATSGALQLVQSLTSTQLDSAPHVVFVTRRAQSIDLYDAESMCVAQAPLVGFARVAINEFPDLRTRLVDIDDAPATLAALASELVSGSQEDEVALRGAKRYVNRLVRRTMADLSESQGRGATDPAAAEAIVALQRATLFGSRDDAGVRSPVGEAFGVVLSAGSEAGDFQPGDSVVFSLEAHPAPSMTVQAKRLTPNKAGVQLPWLLAEYGLTQVGKLAVGQTVCVHVDLNPLALALVRSAAQAGARVFATAVGDALQQACRELGAEQVFSPHSADLRQALMQAGSADGVDLSINATLKPMSSRHLTVLRPYGTHIDLYDGERSNLVDLADAPGSICLIQLELQSLRERCQAHRPTVQKVAARLSDGSHELPLIKHYDSTQVDGAVAIARQDEVASIDFMWDADTMRIRQAMTQSRFVPDETYLVTGGFGGFGLQMAAWMIERGARHLVLVGRKGAHTPEAQSAVEQLVGMGANVVPYAADVSDKNAVQRMIQHVEQTMPPLRGVFHAAAVLDDGPIDGLVDANFAKVLNAKSAGAWYLHLATEHLPLRYFVLFSSIGSLVGSPGQATYVAANAFLDALAQLRRARGMAGLSINWGALAEVGMAARHREVADYLDRVGFGTFTPSVAMAVLGRLLEANPVVIGAAAMDWATLSSFYPAWGRSLRNQEIFGALNVEQTGDTSWQWSELLSPLSPEERLTTLAGLLNQTVADVLKLPQDRIDQSQSLLNMGMDSIMAIELQVQIESRFGVKLSTLELMRGNSLASLNEHLMRMLMDEASSSASAAEPAAGAAAPTSQAAIDRAGSGMTVARLSQLDIRDLHVAIDNMSDEDVERALELLGNDTGVK